MACNNNDDVLTETTHTRNHLIEGGSLIAKHYREASCKNSKCLKYKQKKTFG